MVAIIPGRSAPLTPITNPSVSTPVDPCRSDVWDTESIVRRVNRDESGLLLVDLLDLKVLETARTDVAACTIADNLF